MKLTVSTQDHDVARPSLLAQVDYNLTGFGTAEAFQALLNELGLKSAGLFEGSFHWMSPWLHVETSNNPLTGEQGISQRDSREIGYASYMEARGRQADVDRFMAAVERHATEIKGGGPTRVQRACWPGEAAIYECIDHFSRLSMLHQDLVALGAQGRDWRDREMSNATIQWGISLGHDFGMPTIEEAHLAFVPGFFEVDFADPASLRSFPIAGLLPLLSAREIVGYRKIRVHINDIGLAFCRRYRDVVLPERPIKQADDVLYNAFGRSSAQEQKKMRDSYWNSYRATGKGLYIPAEEISRQRRDVHALPEVVTTLH